MSLLLCEKELLTKPYYSLQVYAKRYFDHVMRYLPRGDILEGGSLREGNVSHGSLKKGSLKSDIYKNYMQRKDIAVAELSALVQMADGFGQDAPYYKTMDDLHQLSPRFKNYVANCRYSYWCKNLATYKAFYESSQDLLDKIYRNIIALSHKQEPFARNLLDVMVSYYNCVHVETLIFKRLIQCAEAQDKKNFVALMLWQGDYTMGDLLNYPTAPHSKAPLSSFEQSATTEITAMVMKQFFSPKLLLTGIEPAVKTAAPVVLSRLKELLAQRRNIRAKDNLEELERDFSGDSHSTAFTAMFARKQTVCSSLADMCSAPTPRVTEGAAPAAKTGAPMVHH